jgi:hypothetical protein
MCVWFGEPSHKQTALTIEDDAHGSTRSFCGVMKHLITCIGHWVDHCDGLLSGQMAVDDSITWYLAAFVASRMTLVKSRATVWTAPGL